MDAVQMLHVESDTSKPLSQQAAERALRLVEASVSASDVLVLTSTPDAAVPVRSALRRALGQVRAPRVVSAMEAALELSGDARHLCADEETILLADLRAHGHTAQTVRAAWAAARQAWATGADPLDSSKQPDIIGALTSADQASGAAPSLAAQRCVEDLVRTVQLRGILPALCAYSSAAQAIETSKMDAAQVSPRYVLLVGANLMPPVALTMARAIASDTVVTLDAPSGASLHAGEHLPVEAGPLAESITVVKWEDPDQEAQGIAQLLASDPMRASDDTEDTWVLAPNRAWERRVEAALVGAHIPCDPGTSGALSSDPRSLAASGALAALAALALAANADDLAAWRLWCALGMRDLGCRVWAALETAANQDRDALLDLVHAISAGREESDPALRPLAARLRAAHTLLTEVASMNGLALVDRIDPVTTPAFRRLVNSSAGTIPARADAAELLSRADAHLAAARHGGRPHAVRLGLTPQVSCVEPARVIVCGCIEGLQEPRELTNVLATSTGEVIFSTVQHMDSDQAKAMGAVFTRNTQVAGVSMAAVRPNPDLAGLGELLPSTLGGQQMLAAQGI